jgi:WD40 repeat protein
MSWTVTLRSIYRDSERARPDRRARLELIARVCDAVEHAHQRGVIHRDLKPANILVDPNGQPKIGVARLISAQAQTLSMHTSRGELLGTVAYMSPEQISADAGEVDTRSDVYALGVILFELLTGELPHDTAGAPILEAMRRIREDEPLRAGSLNRSLRGEIESICAEALRKDKQRRYQSASALADDLRRHLHGEPIEARRDSGLYVLRKTVWRYRWIAATGALLMVLVTSFGVLSSIQSGRNRRLATDLRAALTESYIARGRALARSGDAVAAEDLLWREHLIAPRATRSHWALWELYASDPVLATIGVPTRVAAVAPDGSCFATGEDGGRICLWSARTFERLAALTGHDGIILAIQFSPDSARLASAGQDGTVRIWDLRANGAPLVLGDHAGGATALAFAPDGRLLVTGTGEGSIRAWDPRDASCIARLDEHRQRITALSFSPDGATLASASADRTINLWRRLRSAAVATLVGHKDSVTSIAFSPAGRTLASSCRDQTITLWDLETHAALRSVNAANGTCRVVALFDDRRLLVAGRHRVDEWDLESVRCRPLLHCSSSDAALSPDARLLVSVTITPPQAGIRIVDLSRPAGELRFGGRSNAGVATVSPDGRLIVCGDASGRVRLWNLATGAVERTFECPTWRWAGAQIDPSGRTLAATGGDNVLRLWDLERNSLIRSHEGAGVMTGQATAFSPTDDMIAWVRADGIVELRRVAENGPVVQLPPPEAETLSVRFSPDGRMLAVAHRGNRVELWSVSGDHLGALAVGYTPWTVDFRPDGRELAVATWANEIQVWDLPTRTCAWASSSAFFALSSSHTAFPDVRKDASRSSRTPRRP